MAGEEMAEKLGEAQFLTGFRVIDPEAGSPVELAVYREPASGGLFAVDASFVDQVDEVVPEPFNGRRVRLEDANARAPVVEDLWFRDADGVDNEAVLVNGEIVVTSGKYDPDSPVDCFHVARNLAAALGVSVFDARLTPEALAALPADWNWDEIAQLPRYTLNGRDGEGSAPPAPPLAPDLSPGF